jgi:signal transduction histidine kinase
MSTASRDPIDELADFAARTAKDARRVFAGPDGPLALALGLALVAMAEVTIYADAIAEAMVANLLATLPLALAKRHLAWATGPIVFGVLLALSAEESTLTIAALVGLVSVLYLFALTYGRRWSVLPVLPFLANAIEPFDGTGAGFPGVLLLMVVVAALALGDSRRQRGEVAAERDETRRAMVDTLEDKAAMGERARIARDLHDVVAHHVSAIAVQAESARLTTEGLPDEGRAHFEAIGQTARDALTEMRRLLGVLREDANAEAARDPQPSLARLNELVETARAAGTPVTLTLEGAVAMLPPGVDLCAYRILQEALTNVRRHAPGAAVDVELEYMPTRCVSAFATTAPVPSLRISTGTASWGCASGRSWSAGRLPPALRTAEGSRSTRCCRSRRRHSDDPCRRRRRPGNRPRRLRGAARHAGGLPGRGDRRRR